METLQRLFTVDEYHQMGKAGVFADGERVELLRGVVVPMSPIGWSHSGTVGWLTETFVTALRGHAIVWAQNPVRLDNLSEPEPDVTLLRHREDFYREQFVSPDDVFLVIEVADSSVTKDRRVKIPLYAEAGIAEAWLIVLPKKRIEIYRQPVDGRYELVEIVSGDQEIAPLAFPDLRLIADAIFGERHEG